MKCPNCGNEVSAEETFCGQCGMPKLPPAGSTEAVSTPFPRSGTLPPRLNQQEGFYRDATEEITVRPGMAEQGDGYPPPTSPTPSSQYPGSGQYTPQHFQYPGSTYPTQYATPVIPPPPQRKQNSNTALIIVSICLAVTLLSVIGFAAFYLLRGHTTTQTAAPPSAVATTAPTPTQAPSPTATPTALPSPTVAADNGFALCGQPCTNNGFLVEYPQNWQLAAADNANGIKFSNQDQFASFKAPGPTSSAAGDLVMSDLQTNFAYREGYQPPTSASTTTIGNETWVTQTVYYQNNNQRMRLDVYATVHQGKAYIIELQAQDAQFMSINAQYFATMLGKFQFVQTP
ncbi:MAG: zinc-ribbon domain-containing protein [Chloroflexi bacterium]|nr:zinc-ribbon domain-containing protein [Chloroflexota bacterium]